MLCEDMIIKISELLTNKAKSRLTRISKIFDTLKHKFIYNGMININKIKNLSYFDNFKCICIKSDENIFPKHVKDIYYVLRDKYIPQHVTHLIFGYKYPWIIGYPINLNIPTSVFRLSFNDSFNQPLKYSIIIPPSITHLQFGYEFNQPIKDIPTSVTHLLFSYHFNQPIENIPSSITYLSLGAGFEQTLNDVPRTVKEIRVCRSYDKPIDEDVASRITYY